MKFLLLVCISILVFTTNLPAQNLVPNPGFEEITSCPLDMSNDSSGITKAKHWFTDDNNSSPDLFNECIGKEYFQPRGRYLLPKSGKGYAGIISLIEVLEVRLKSPLIKNKTYRIQMYVHDPDSIKVPYSPMLYSFSNVVIIRKYIDESLIRRNVIGMGKNDSNESNHTKWKLFSAYYTAKGGEKYFALGGLNTSKKIAEMGDEEYHRVIPWTPYYYIDDVSVEEDTTASSSGPAAFQGKLVTGQKLTLKNIYFETSKANLLTASDKELDALAKALKSNPSVSLNICGYTDSTGNEKSNIELSTKRAEAVRNYLVSKGIALKRLKCEGFGSANPVADNKTEEGRQQNRRVEIEVIATH